ncbi:laccase 12 [Actinidia rufa]|uniref:laccase n=1 Tax=Actinidia rufa TaxID=165716 RepID=A0A7J0HA32_9ERIC|nr:laccase 12 [Actinidia rufa]
METNLRVLKLTAIQTSSSPKETQISDLLALEYKTKIQETPVTRLCRTHNIITVNGQFPGPTLKVQNGDTLVVKVLNSARSNVTIHWHGIRQMRTPWADSPKYVTQCPIKPGGTYTYWFTIENQEGALWRGNLAEINREWWNRDHISVPRQAIFTGPAPNVSDAYIICNYSSRGARTQRNVRSSVDSGDRIILRIINAALNQQLFFAVANHRLTVVAADAAYTKPITTSTLMLGPGQTNDVLLTADQTLGRYYMAARAYATIQNAPFTTTTTTTTAILEYKSTNRRVPTRPTLPRLPANKDTATATSFTTQFRSHSRVKVPTAINENLFFIVGLGLSIVHPDPGVKGLTIPGLRPA